MRTTESAGEILTYRPVFFQPGEALPADETLWRKRDLLPEQLEELVAARCVGPLEGAEEVVREAILQDVPLADFGTWVHFPWSGELFRILPRDLYRELRLDRNRNKITASEQLQLLERKAAVVGLSVGNAIALTLAQEGVVGSLVLADFDELSTSNLNRIRASITGVGLPKTVLAARELAGLDPYLEVTCLHDGATEENLADLFDGVDVLVDACDGLAMKVRLREVARDRGIPVVMETSDRGMLDVERFDHEPDRPLLHGLLGDLDSTAVRTLGDGERLALVARIVGYGISTRAAASMLEIDATLSTWPQLASDVAAGGAQVTQTARRLLLGEYVPSGRTWREAPDPGSEPVVPAPAVTRSVSVRGLSMLHRQLIEAAVQAPSGGNCQPWGFEPRGRDLVVHHLRDRSRSLLDADGFAGLVSVGMAVEGLALEAARLGYRTRVAWTGAEEGPVAVVRTSEGGTLDPLVSWVGRRFTDRRTPGRVPLEGPAILRMLRAMGDRVRLQLATDPRDLELLGRWIGAVDRVRFLHPELHREMWEEVRWSDADAQTRPDGISVGEMAVGPADEPVLRLMRRPDVAAFLRRTGGGSRLGELAERWVASASALGMFHVDATDPAHLLEAGRGIYRAWLAAVEAGYAIQPVGVAAYMVRHLGTPLEAGYRREDVAVLEHADEAFTQAFPEAHPGRRVLLFRVLAGGNRYAPTHRRPLGEALVLP